MEVAHLASVLTTPATETIAKVVAADAKGNPKLMMHQPLISR